jgi:hypothetical protein
VIEIGGKSKCLCLHCMEYHIILVEQELQLELMKFALKRDSFSHINFKRIDLV